MKIIHSNTLDGRMAAYLVKQAHKTVILSQDDFQENNWGLEAVKPFEPVFILDTAPPHEETFRSLLKITPEVVWFTHHQDQIEAFPLPEFAGLRGSRMVSQSTTIQVASHFLVADPKSQGFSYIDRYALNDPTPQALWFGLGAEIRDTRPYADSETFLKHLIAGTNSIIQETIQDGKIVAAYQESLKKRGFGIFRIGFDAAASPPPEKKTPPRAVSTAKESE